MDVDIVDMDHAAIHVTDLDEALTFYHDLLGMEIRDRRRYNEGEVPYVAVVAGGRHIHLVPADESPSNSADGSRPAATARSSDGQPDGTPDEAPFHGDHLCLLVRSDDIDSKAHLESLLTAVEEAGYTVEPDEPKKRYGAYGRDWAAYVRDPDGRRVELKIH